LQKSKAQAKKGSYVLNYLKSDKDVDGSAIHKTMHKLTLRQIEKEAGYVDANHLVFHIIFLAMIPFFIDLSFSFPDT
jgi:hypothetical protein